MHGLVLDAKSSGDNGAAAGIAVVIVGDYPLLPILPVGIMHIA